MTHLSRLVAVAHMKQDTVEQLRVAAPAVVGTSITWGVHDALPYVSLAVGMATLIFILVQMAFLLRKWYLREKHGWFSSSLEKDTE